MRLLGLIFAVLIAVPAFSADTFNIDSDHAFVIFKVRRTGFANAYGRFDKISGTIQMDSADVTKSAVDITIDTGSVTTASEKRDKHLKSPDFFDAKQFPKANFKSESIKKIDDKTFEITGKLTIHGVTKPLTIKWNQMGLGKDYMQNTRIGGETVFTFKRSDFGIKFMAEGVSDEVQVTASIEGVKSK